MEGVVKRLDEAAFERFGNDGMGGQKVVSLDDAIEIFRNGGNEKGMAEGFETNLNETQTEVKTIEKLKVTKADIVVKGNVDKPYYVIIYHEVGKDYDNEGFGSYDLSNVFKWREEEMEIVRNGGKE